MGFSHDVRYTLPEALRAFLPEPTLIGLYGIDKNQARASSFVSQAHRFLDPAALEALKLFLGACMRSRSMCAGLQDQVMDIGRPALQLRLAGSAGVCVM